MNDYVELQLKGITYNQIESGVYALILEEPTSKTRLAIVIGYPEAQSIECHLQRVRTPRPLSHDVMASILTGLNARLSHVYIHKIPSGPYVGDLHLIDEIGREIIIDSRSSDAIALALRVNAPIYASKELLEREGFKPEEKTSATPAKVTEDSPKDKNVEDNGLNDISLLSIEELKERLKEEVDKENYEEASRIKKEIDNRQNESAS